MSDLEEFQVGMNKMAKGTCLVFIEVFAIGFLIVLLLQMTGVISKEYIPKRVVDYAKDFAVAFDAKVVHMVGPGKEHERQANEPLVE